MIVKSDFYQYLIDNFSSDIGTYEFEKVPGILNPAIAILPNGTYGYRYPPPKTSTQGIEFVVYFESTVTGLINRGLLDQQTLRIVLQQHTNNGKDLQFVGNCLERALKFEGYNVSSVLLQQSEALQVLPQYRIDAVSLEAEVFVNGSS